MGFSATVITTNQWGALPPKNAPFELTTPRYIIIHHADNQNPPKATTMKIHTLCLALSTLLLGACASYLSQTDKVDFAGPFQIIDRDSFEEVDLIRILDPNGNAQSHNPTAWATLTPGQKIDKSIDQFYQNIEKQSSSEKQAARNRVQDRVLAASTQRCGAFKSNLQRAYSRTNFGLGVATTVAGIGGAISSGLYTSKYLAGLSGLFGGTRAEFNQDYYANLTVNVVVDGIEIRQQEVFRQISLNGQSKPLELYSVEAAIKDAIFYHNQCSLTSGLQAASEAIKFSADPGLDGATRIMLKAQNLKRIAEGNAPDTSVPGSIEKLGLSGRLYAGSLLHARGDAGLVLGAVIEAKERTKKLADEFKVRLDNQKGGFEDADAGKNLSKLLDATQAAVSDQIKACEAPAKDLMAQLAEKQALLPFAPNGAALGSRQAEIQTLNVKAGFITASAQRQLEEFASTLRFAVDKLGKPEQKTPRSDSDAAQTKLKGLTPIPKLCAGI